MLSEKDVKLYRSGKGSPYLSASEVMDLLPWLNQNGLFIQSMEAVQIVERGKDEPRRLEFAILGLDGGDDWENHYDIERINSLARQKLQGAIEEGGEFEFQIWIDYGSEYDEERAERLGRASS